MTNKKEIPTFSSIKEEAEFWDTADITDYLGELTLADAVYTPKEGETKTVMTIRIAPSLKERIEEIATSYDIPTSSLIRMWIVDRIRALN